MKAAGEGTGAAIVDVYNESLFEIIELNSKDYQKFQRESELVIAQLKD